MSSFKEVCLNKKEYLHNRANILFNLKLDHNISEKQINFMLENILYKINIEDYDIISIDENKKYSSIKYKEIFFIKIINFTYHVGVLRYVENIHPDIELFSNTLIDYLSSPEFIKIGFENGVEWNSNTVVDNISFMRYNRSSNITYFNKNNIARNIILYTYSYESDDYYTNIFTNNNFVSNVSDIESYGKYICCPHDIFSAYYSYLLKYILDGNILDDIDIQCYSIMDNAINNPNNILYGEFENYSN